jgi:hypothetical protein
MKKEIEHFFIPMQEDHQVLNEKVDYGFDRLDNKINQLEAKVDKGFYDMHMEMAGKFQSLETKIDDKLDHLNDNVEAIAVMIKEQKIDNNHLERRISHLEKSRI